MRASQQGAATHHGFGCVRCDTCAEERLVAYSCKTRGFCPSFLLARNSELLSQTLGVFLAKLFAWQRRHARAHGIADLHAGAITFVQRFGSLLNLNCHAQAVLPDGVFAAGPDGAVQFHPLPPWDDDVARLLGQIARAIHRLVERHLVQRGDDEPLELLAAEQAQAITALPWPDRAPPPNPPAIAPHFSTATRSTPVVFSTPTIARASSDYAVMARDPRSPTLDDPTGRVILSLKHPLRDGRTEFTFTPVDFLRRLAPLIPPPRRHLTRYHAVFAPHHHLRAAIRARCRC